jgi:hypothetical protein
MVITTGVEVRSQTVDLGRSNEAFLAGGADLRSYRG